MHFTHLLTTIPATLTTLGDAAITGVVYDTRQVQPGSLFVAYRGFHADGHSFIDAAIARGATAVVYEDPAWDGRIPVPAARVSNARTALAPLAAAFYGYPGRSLRVVGITGTDGKTTTTALTAAVLDAGGRSGLIGTVDFKIGPRVWANSTRQSTPEAPEIQAMLREMVADGCTHAVLESTSHALSRRWDRLVGCDFDVAVLTNVTQEHLDFHGTVEQYRQDKARLFALLGERTTDHRPQTTSSIEADAANRLQNAHANITVPVVRGPWSVVGKAHKTAIVNADDPHHQLFLDAAPASAQRLTYAVHAAADVRASNVHASAAGLRYTLITPWGNREVALQLTGDFNVHNSLAALSVALAEGVDLDAALAALSAVPGVRGRMERIDCGQPFTVLVDYAHTPGSFAKLFGIIRPLATRRLIIVFGSAGERDVEKRAIQGKLAAEYGDLLILTDEDPRGEDRHAIIAQIAAGAEQAGKREGHGYLRIADRAQAIRAAIHAAEPGDVVLLLGKGHEGSIIYATGSIPWNESAEARAALAEHGYRT